MSERYSDGSVHQAGSDAAHAAGASEPAAADARCRALLAQLLPDADVELLLRALRDEAARPPAREGAGAARNEADLPPADRELYRVRLHLALGARAQMIQHSINNPLAALLAEAQLLEMEPLAEEHRVAATRIVDLARRVVAVVRRLDAAEVMRGT